MRTAILQQQVSKRPVAPPAPPQTASCPTAEQVAAVLGAPIENVRTNLPLVLAALAEQGIGDRATVIAALATIGVEVGSFAPIPEYGDWDYFESNYGWQTSVGQQLGNTQYGDGATYHGRGFVQITGKANYRRYGEMLGLDLVNRPDLALDANTAARILALYFVTHGIPALAAAGNWLGVRRAVNGGTNGWDRFAKLVDRLEAL